MPTLYTSLLQHLPRAERERKAAITAERPAALVPAESVLPSDREPSKPVSGPRVTVVGAGFAGLTAAYELTHLGFVVTVVDAQKRLGGRVYSVQDIVSGKTIEGGGELIGSNRPAWNAYKKKFKLTFLPVSDGGNSPIILKDRLLTAAQNKRLAKELHGEILALTDQAKPIDADEPWNSPNAPDLDRTPLANWIAGRSCSPIAKLALKAQLEADNGAPASKQSLLGNLAMIKGGNLESYWTETEVWRCSGGNQQLAENLALILPPERMKCGVPAVHISTKNKVVVKLANGEKVEGEEVVLAVPPSVWDKIGFSPSLDKNLKPSMGQNVKFAMFPRKVLETRSPSTQLRRGWTY